MAKDSSVKFDLNLFLCKSKKGSIYFLGIPTDVGKEKVGGLKYFRIFPNKEKVKEVIKTDVGWSKEWVGFAFINDPIETQQPATPTAPITKVAETKSDENNVIDEECPF